MHKQYWGLFSRETSEKKEFLQNCPFSLHLRFRFKKVFLVIIVSCCGMYTTLQSKHTQHQTDIYCCFTGHWDHGIFFSCSNKKGITMKWLSWMAAHNYLFAVSRCCSVGSGKGFTGRTECFFLFVFHFCGNIKNTWVSDKVEEGQRK